MKSLSDKELLRLTREERNDQAGELLLRRFGYAGITPALLKAWRAPKFLTINAAKKIAAQPRS